MKHQNFMVEYLVSKKDEFGCYTQPLHCWFYTSKEARSFCKSIKKDDTVIFASISRFKNDCSFLSETIIFDRRGEK